MTPKNSANHLRNVFVVSGLWDSLAGLLYLFAVGADRAISTPPTHNFYSVFLASFFFCFAYLQFIAARNIRRYAIVVGCLIAGRSAYVLLLYSFMLFDAGFPSTFWFTGIIDATFTVLYGVFAHRSGFGLRALFAPVTE